MIEGDAFYTEYIGLDYSVALDMHLYHYAVRDMISWAMLHAGYQVAPQRWAELRSKIAHEALVGSY